MNNVQVFTNQLFGSVRSLEINGEPWFVGADVASCLGYSNTRDALAKHVDEEDKNTVAIRDASSIQSRNMTIINESGLYSLIFGSKLPAARQFKHWVTKEILPTMRKLGFDQSIQLLQEELQKKEELIRYLQIQNSNVGEIAASNAFNSAEKRFLECAIVNTPYLTDDQKLELFKYDPTELNPEYDLDSDINKFKIRFGLL